MAQLAHHQIGSSTPKWIHIISFNLIPHRIAHRLRPFHPSAPHLRVQPAQHRQVSIFQYFGATSVHIDPFTLQGDHLIRSMSVLLGSTASLGARSVSARSVASRRTCHAATIECRQRVPPNRGGGGARGGQRRSEGKDRCLHIIGTRARRLATVTRPLERELSFTPDDAPRQQAPRRRLARIRLTWLAQWSTCCRTGTTGSSWRTESRSWAICRVSQQEW